MGLAVGNSQFAISDVRLRVDGADALALDSDVLRLTTALGEYTLPLLQVVGAADANLASPTITGDQVALPFASAIPNLQAGAFDLLYSTFLGGIGRDEGYGIAVDGVGNAYVTGFTESSDFPTTAGAFDISYNFNRDAFVVKVNAGGTGLVYATFLGGIDDDRGCAIAVDGAGSAYVAGRTGSSDFPTTAGAFDTSYNGDGDAFVVKVNAAGTGLAYATFLGGSDFDKVGGGAIAVDGGGNAYVTGFTGSSDFPTTAGAFDTSYNGDDAFVVKANATGTGLAYATFLGGSNEDGDGAIAVDGAGSAYVMGSTLSSDFPTTAGAFDTSYNGIRDAFVVKVNAAGTGLVYATFLGGSDDDRGYAIAVDGAGSAYVAGRTRSSNFPTTAGAFETIYNGNGDAFAVKVNAAGTGLAYATFLGGSDSDKVSGGAIAVDGVGSAYVTGSTLSSDFPTTAGAFDTSHNGDGDAFVVKVNAAGTDLAYATFLGRSDEDGGGAIAVDGAGSAYVAGWTSSSDFPTTAGAFDTSYGGGTCGTEPETYPCRDAFVVKVNDGGTGLDYATFLGGSSSEERSAIAVDGAGSAYVTGATWSSDFPTTAGAFDTSHNGDMDAFVAKLTFPVVGTVTPSGGSLASSADRTTYTFAVGTFTDTMMITHIPLPFSNVPPASSLVDIGRAFSVTAVYSDTGQPAQPTQSYTVTVQYTEAEKGPAIENTLALYSWDSSQWMKELSSEVDTVSNTVTATPNHFSPWAVLGETLRTFLPIILKSY